MKIPLDVFESLILRHLGLKASFFKNQYIYLMRLNLTPLLLGFTQAPPSVTNNDTIY